MKTLIILFAFLMLALGSCETVEIEKLITDTVYVDRPVIVQTLVPTVLRDTVIKTLIRVDTVEITLVQHDTIINNIVVHDTVLQVLTDSVFIERIVERVVHHTDTVIVTVVDTVINNVIVHDTVTKTIIQHDTVEVIRYQEQKVYRDTLLVFIAGNTFWVPNELFPIYQQFFIDARSYGYSPDETWTMMMVYVDEDKLPGEGWSSNSFVLYNWRLSWHSNQWVMEIRDDLPTEYCYSAIYRCMAQFLLNIKYTRDGGPSDPIYDPYQISFNDSEAKKKLYLDALFK